jgi:hypothetical protein
MKPLVVEDPRGVTWYLTLSTEIVGIDHLERAIARSGMTEREKDKRRSAIGVRIYRELKGGWAPACAELPLRMR